MCCRRRILNCFLQLLHQAHSAPALGLQIPSHPGHRVLDWMIWLAGRTRFVWVLSMCCCSQFLLGWWRGICICGRRSCTCFALLFLWTTRCCTHGNSQLASLLPHGFVSTVKSACHISLGRKLCMRWLLHAHWLSPHWPVVYIPFLSGETRFSS